MIADLSQSESHDEVNRAFFALKLRHMAFFAAI
jgi:hypothetical protein